MNIHDFRFMRQGKHLAELLHQESGLIEGVNQLGEKKERALLVLHGFSSTPAVYRYLIPQIKHYDALICPSLPGHGQSTLAFEQTKASDWLSMSKALCDTLMNEYKKVDVLGLSLGGLLACELSKHFKLHHLYLLAPALKLEMHIGCMLKTAQLAHYLGFSQLRNGAGNLLHEQHSDISYRTLPLASIIELLRLIQNFQWIPPTCPVDVFLGKHDGVVASKKVEALFAPMTNAHIHWLNDSAHVLPLDNDLDKIAECINQNNL